MQTGSKMKILVCDDKDRMRDYYSKALSNLDNTKIITTDHPSHVLDLLRADKKIVVLLMDLGFPSEPGKNDNVIIGHIFLPQIREEFPQLKIVIVTQLGPRVYPIVLECHRKCLFDEWIDVGKDFKESEIMARVQPLIYPLGDVSQHGLWLVHLSDLHFGKSNRTQFWGKAEDGQLYDSIKNDLQKTIPSDFPEAKDKSDLIVITGDLTNNARDEQFEKVEEFIRNLAKECLRIPIIYDDKYLNRVLIVPGNHDVNFDISMARCIDVDKKKKYRIRQLAREEEIKPELRYLKKYVWGPFERFYIRSQITSPTFSMLWNKDNYFSGALWSIPELGVLVFGVNTSAEGIDHFTKKPGVSPKTIKQLESNVTPETILPKILIAHHSLGSTSTSSERASEESLDSLRKAFSRNLDARIFLTGHMHEETSERISVDGKSLLFISAGSAGIEHSGVMPGFGLHYNLINIRPHGITDNSPDRVVIYSRVFYGNEFVRHPKYPKQEYTWNDESGWEKQV